MSYFDSTFDTTWLETCCIIEKVAFLSQRTMFYVFIFWLCQFWPAWWCFRYNWSSFCNTLYTAPLETLSLAMIWCWERPSLFKTIFWLSLSSEFSTFSIIYTFLWRVNKRFYSGLLNRYFSVDFLPDVFHFHLFIWL